MVIATRNKHHTQTLFLTTLINGGNNRQHAGLR